MFFYQYVLPLFLSFFMSWLLIIFSKRLGLLSHPTERGMHFFSVPTSGGIAILFSMMITTYVQKIERIDQLFLLFLLPSFVIAVVGLIDDRKGLSPAIRMIFQFFVVIWSVAILGAHDLVPHSEHLLMQATALIFSAIGMVWFINASNFMDGIDGYLPINSIIIMIAYVVLTTNNEYFGILNSEQLVYLDLKLLLATSCAAIAGFVLWNFPIAKLFLGDAGSGLIGFWLAIFAYIYVTLDIKLVYFVLIVNGAIVFDASLTLIIRFLKNEDIFKAHRDHIYQKLALSFGSHKIVTCFFAVISVFWLLPIGFLSLTLPIPGIYFLLIAYVPFFLIASYAGRTKKS